MIRDLISSLHARWANLHPFIRFMCMVAVMAVMGLIAVKPAYGSFRQWRMDRNLAAAHSAVKENRMQEARDLSMTVLRSGEPSIEAFRILEKATEHLRDPRHADIARALISHPEGTDEDRLTGFLGIVMELPLGLVGQAWSALPAESKEDPRFATAFARRLIAEKRLGEATSVLLAVPGEARDEAARQALARVLIGSGKREGFEEVQRMIVAELAAGEARVSAWLDVLEDLPVLSLREDLLAPVRSLRPPADVDPARMALILARMDYAAQWSTRAASLAKTIAKWKDPSPRYLAAFLGDLRLHEMLLETYQAEHADRYPELYPLLLEAAERSDAHDTVRELLDACGERMPKPVELAHRALLASKTGDATTRGTAWKAAIEAAKADASHHSLLGLHRIALDAGLDDLAGMAMVEAIRSGRGPLPLYQDLKSLCASLAAQDQESTVLEICAIYLNFEPSNPVLRTQYAYLACLSGVIEPEKLFEPLQLLATAFPKELPIHFTLASAYLCAGQAAMAAEVLDPLELKPAELPPAFRVVYLTSQLLNSRMTRDDPQIAEFPWKALQHSERRKFSELIRGGR